MQISAVVAGLRYKEARYIVASDGFTDLSIKRAIGDWLLEVPVIVLLLMIIALQISFYAYLLVLEKKHFRS